MRAGTTLDLADDRTTRPSGGTRRTPRPRWSTSWPSRRRSPDAAVRRGTRSVARRAAGDGRRRQGRHDPHRAVRRQPGRGRRRLVRRAERRGARPRLPVAGPPHAPGAGRSACSTAATTRTCSSCGCKSFVPEGGVAAPLPPHPRVRADAGRGGHDRRQAVPPHLQGRAARAPAGPPRRSRRALEVPRAATSTTGRCGTTTRRRSADAIARTRPTTRRGTSCRPTASGCATSPSPRSCATTSSASIPQYPAARGGHRGPRRDADERPCEPVRVLTVWYSCRPWACWSASTLDEAVAAIGAHPTPSCSPAAPT